MKKKFRIDFRLLIVFMLCLLLGNLCVFWFQSPDMSLETKLFSSYEKGKEKLTLNSRVFVINISSEVEGEMDSGKKNELDRKRLSEIRYLTGKQFLSARGVFILGTDLLSQPSNERECVQTFRNAKNVFWHYNHKNFSHYLYDDKCGQLKFLDSSDGGRERFQVFGKKKYDKNFASYYLMTLGGNKVYYDDNAHVYSITEPSGRKQKLYALEDGSIRIRQTSSYDVEYYDMDELYELLHKTPDMGKNLFRDSVVFLQDEKKVSEYDKSETSDITLADYYINVLGTIENEATVPTMTKGEVMVFVSIGMILNSLAVMFWPTWASILTALVFLGGSLLINMFLFQFDIYYLPVTLFLIVISISFLLLFTMQQILGRIGVRNLPIDAVIRFTDTIVKIEHSVSYAEYLMQKRKEIEEDISASLLLPVMERKSFLLKELSEENYRNRRFVESEFGEKAKNSGSSVIQTRTNLFQGEKYIAFVPLPVFDVESEAVTYTVIGLKKKLKPQSASYISMMLFSMYIYFKAQHERGEHQRMYFSMLSLMISVIDAKDPVTAGHSQRVANISRDIGIWMRLNKKEQIDLEFTALLHDIGKIGVSDYVLNKPSVYTQNDFEQMKYHTIRGAEMLSEVGISEDIIDGVRHHHERMDGKGYPDGLKGSELHLFAKIIKIADVFDALTSKRQYKEEWEIEKALNIIYKGRGTEFDTEIANVFVEHMSPPGWIPPVDASQRRRRTEDPNAESAIHIFNDFFEKYDSYLTIEYPISSKKAKRVDFAYKSGFMKYDWGETFNNPAFLEAKPMILAYENETKSLLFGQTSSGNGVHSIYYYFFKGFVNMGVFLLEQSKVKETLALLADLYGEPQVIDAQTEIFLADKMRIVFYRTDDERCLLFYISDYMCNNYVFK